MRKDVKLGVAVAGLLVAVLLVYWLVPKGEDPANQAGDGQVAFTNPDQTGQDPDAGTGETADPGSTDPGAGTDPAGESEPPDAVPPQRQDPFEPSNSIAGTGTGGQDDGAATDEPTPDGGRSGETAVAGGPSGDTNWTQLLADGRMRRAEGGSPDHPGLIAVTETPRPGTSGNTQGATGGGNGTGDPAGTDVNDGLPETASAFQDQPAGTGPAGGAGNGISGTVRDTGPGTAPGTGAGTNTAIAGSGGRTHVVQKGETLSSIAQVAYGSARHYLLIERANPDVDPRSMRPGTVIKLPELTEAAAAPAAGAGAGGEVTTAGARTGASAPRAAAEAPINPATQYRVQSGDSLYKIAVKLYNKPGRVDDLYEANRQLIGDDPERLKVGMVLTLPDAPTAASAR